ncbi:MAG: double zinc ribbon domain-containing protein [Treponema sp.]|jgi:ComF family protein|nr:double zinc ribbon domain-containing protein [Treponema sp.]
MEHLIIKLHRWKEIIREEFFPRGCALCGKSLDRNGSAFYGLCVSCREKLEIPGAEWGRCSCCGQPLISEKETCLSCRNGPERSFDKVVSLFPYIGKYQKILRAYKFNQCLCLGNFFIEKLLHGLELLFDCNEEYVNSSLSGNDAAWVPVPAKPGKIKHMGWDQIEYLAKLLEIQNSSEKSFPVCRCLKRLSSESQKELNKENRLQNLKGRIIAKKHTDITSHKGKTLTVPRIAVIFDDVYTTGATMDACASALKSGGAERVYGICLCYD